MSHAYDAGSPPVTVATSTFTPLDRLLRDRVFAGLARLRTGRLVVRDAFGTRAFGDEDTTPIHLLVHDPSVYRRIAARGSLAAGEAYVDGKVDCSDLVGLLRLFARDLDTTNALERGIARVSNAAELAMHGLRRNTRAGSRENIAAHYDLGNDLFELFLDDTMMYSSAVFESTRESLEVAQLRKLDRVCRKLDLRSDDHLVEIGTGWGGMAIHAARTTGCRVTTTTISKEQRDYAIERVARAGLSDRVTVLLEDYRDLRGTYDKLVSIEMVEAVGADFLDDYARRCGALLRDDGLALIQAITIEDHRYEQALRSVDFIKRHVFPGCFIPSVSVLTSSFARTTDLRLVDLEDFGPSYARTLAAWRERFEENEETVLGLRYDRRFVRYWSYYLAYCEAGFEERRLGVGHFLFARPRNRTRPSRVR